MSDFGKTKAGHQRIREMLSVYIDGELPSGDRVRVEEHLAECADCTWELETLRQTVDLVGQLPKVPVPRAFTIYETPRPRRAGLFQARWVYTYLKGATALAAALLILVLAGDALFQFQRVTTGFAPTMAPAKEIAAPAAAPTVVARQEVPPAPAEAPISPEEALDEADGAAYAEVTPSPSPVEETKALALMPTPTAPADRGGGGPAATPLATPAPLVDKAGAADTPLPSAAMEAPAEEEAPEAPVAPTAAPMGTPQPQMTATPSPAATLAPADAATATPTPLATATATATATPAPTATPVSMARAPAEARPTGEEDAFAGLPTRPQEPRLTLLRVVEVSLCLLVMVLIAATLIVRRLAKT
ncbi:MAG: zf-HC2 domain-containing protein [Anaerolineae bacterium]